MMIDKTLLDILGAWYHYLVCFAIYYRLFFSEKLWTSGLFRPLLIRVIQKVCSLETSNFWPTPPLFIPVHFTCTPYQRMVRTSCALVSYSLSKKVPQHLWIFEWKIREWKERKVFFFFFSFFLRTEHNNNMFFKQLYIQWQ